MLNLYVQKIVSQNPPKYKYISLREAHKKYHDYIVLFSKAQYGRRDEPKTLEQWLKSEI